MKRIYNCWNNKEIEFLKSNYTNSNADLLKLNLNNHSWNAIQIKAFYLRLKRKIELHINDDFFKVWNPKMAYTFGFWIADGYMGKNNNNVSFCSKDYTLLEMIKSNLGSEHKIGKDHSAFQLQICSKIIYDDLLKIGGVPAKSLIIQFPEVPDEYSSHFIRGEFDGDGCNYIMTDKRRTPNYRYLKSNFTGNIDFLTGMKDKIKKNTGIDPTGLYHCTNGNKRIYRLEYIGEKAILLGNYIYQESENLRLERKYNIYKKMKNEYLKKLENKKMEGEKWIKKLEV